MKKQSNQNTPEHSKQKPPQLKCNSCMRGYNGRNGNGYQPCGCKAQKSIRGIGQGYVNPYNYRFEKAAA